MRKPSRLQRLRQRRLLRRARRRRPRIAALTGPVENVEVHYYMNGVEFTQTAGTEHAEQ